LKEKFNVKLPEFIPKLIHVGEKSEFERIRNTDLAELKFQNMPNTIVGENDDTPNFISVNRLDFEGVEIHGGIIKDSTAKGGLKYSIIQPRLSVKDKKNFDIITKLLMTELSVSLNEIKTKKDAERRLKRKIIQLIKKYKLEIPTKNLSKITYYAIRNFIYLGKIEPLMRDHMIEEISCDGTGIPLYIWHREYESIPTNIIFNSDKELDNFARKVSYICGKHVSMANPIIDASLPDGSRINLTLGHEITNCIICYFRKIFCRYF